VHVLVAEDDPRLAELLAQSLREAGWVVHLVADGHDAYAAAADLAATWDVIVLDRMLPGADGDQVVARLRSLGVTTPVLMLTARGRLEDRVSGLDAGADDYLVKPFELDELLARLRALGRRGDAEERHVWRLDGLVVDASVHQVTRDGRSIDLSPREFAILRLLVSRAGRLVTRYDILDEVWDGDTDIRSNVIDVHIASIRAKVDRPFGTRTIGTVRGVGYRADRVE
jgi:two-component system OmpR family response regulator